VDPVTLGVLVGAVAIVGIAFVAAVVALWVLRKTVALVKRLVVVLIAFALVAGCVAAAAALVLASS
jgi:hypothetical protein